ncbi:hypothetical protein LTR94_030250, partial [Friedmanniomyces endolithicus]
PPSPLWPLHPPWPKAGTSSRAVRPRSSCWTWIPSPRGTAHARPCWRACRRRARPTTCPIPPARSASAAAPTSPSRAWRFSTAPTARSRSASTTATTSTPSPRTRWIPTSRTCSATASAARPSTRPSAPSSRRDGRA